MTTSGTTAWSPTIAEIIEEAAERAGFELRTGYQLRTATRSLNFLCAEWASRGLNLWTVDQQTLSLVAGTSSYTLPSDTVDVIEAVWTQNAGTASQTDINIERYTVSQWAQIVNKLSPGIPIVYYVQRLENAPVLNIYFQPDQAYTLTYWRLRRLQDAGSVTNTMDIPFRFVPALTSGLAFHLATKMPKSDQRVMPLKQAYEEAFQMAADEDRDRSSFFFVPDVGMH